MSPNSGCALSMVNILNDKQDARKVSILLEKFVPKSQAALAFGIQARRKEKIRERFAELAGDDMEMDREEFLVDMHRRGYPTAWAEAAFSQFDADGSGSITMDEYILGITALAEEAKKRGLRTGWHGISMTPIFI